MLISVAVNSSAEVLSVQYIRMAGACLTEHVKKELWFENSRTSMVNCELCRSGAFLLLGTEYYHQQQRPCLSNIYGPTAPARRSEAWQGFNIADVRSCRNSSQKLRRNSMSLQSLSLDDLLESSDPSHYHCKAALWAFVARD